MGKMWLEQTSRKGLYLSSATRCKQEQTMLKDLYGITRILLKLEKELCNVNHLRLMSCHSTQTSFTGFDLKMISNHWCMICVWWKFIDNWKKLIWQSHVKWMIWLYLILTISTTCLVIWFEKWLLYLLNTEYQTDYIRKSNKLY